MAAKNQMAQYVANITTCPICLDDVTNPKSLPCLHNFCLNCIHDHCRDNSPGDEVNCPVCRSVFVIPERGVEQLPNNFIIKGLAALACSMQNDVVRCEACGDNSEMKSDISAAVWYCTGCGWKLCDRCGSSHRRIPGGAHHVVPFRSEIQEDVIKIQKSFCDVHANNVVEIYCNECRKNICVTCHSLRHKAHECQDIDDTSNEFRRKIETHIKLVSDRASTIPQEKDEVTNKHQEFMTAVGVKERSLRQAADETKRHIDAVVAQLIHGIANQKMTASKTASVIKCKLDVAQAEMQSYINDCRELLNSGKPWEITQAMSDLNQRANKLLKDGSTGNYCHSSDINVTKNDLFDHIYYFAKKHSPSK